MKIKEIIRDAFYAKRCRQIHKWIEIRGVQILLLAVVEGRNDIQLWYMSRSHYRADLRQEMAREGLEDDCTQLTNRQYLQLSMREDSGGGDFSIDSVALNDTPMKVIASEGRGFYEGNIKNWMALQFFYEQGLDLSPWESVESNEIMLNCATLQADEGVDIFTVLEPEGSVKVAIIIGDTSQRFPLKEPLRFTAASNESKTIHYSDPATDSLRSIHIEGIMLHDMWATMEQGISEGWGSQLSQEERKEAMERMEESMSDLCPKGKGFALLLYAEEENRQLEIYETAHLNSLCKVGSTVSSVGFFGQDDSLGPYGHHYRLAPIRVMDPGEVEVFEVFEVELLGGYVWVEGERVEV